MKEIIRNRSGFTLVEALISIMIFSVVTGAVYAALIAGNRSFHYYESSVAVKGEIRRAMDWMTRELREAKNLVVISEEGSLRINFYRPAIGNISYVWSRGGDESQKIVRFANGEKSILAKNIGYMDAENHSSALVLKMYDREEAQKPDAAAIGLTKKITLRNQTKLFL